MVRRFGLALAVLSLAYGAQAKTRTAEESDVLRASRPSGRETFGIYISGKKVGYTSTSIAVDRAKGTVACTTEVTFRTLVGSVAAQRSVTEVKTFENKRNGKLLAFSAILVGDGGNQRLEGTSSAKGIAVKRSRPGEPMESIQLPPILETVEDCDPARVALLRHTNFVGTILDTMDLKPTRQSSTVIGMESKRIAGVDARLQRVETYLAKDKLTVVNFYDAAGRLIETRLGPTWTAVAEAPEVARDFDSVELFNLTRVVLSAPIPGSPWKVPGRHVYAVTGLPESLWHESARQKFRKLSSGKAELTVTAVNGSESAKRPLPDPEGGPNLESSISVEAASPKIRELANKIAGGESDARKVAQAVNRWVFRNLVKEYGVSNDRATGVLESLRGDCTEHSLLAVSLLRALGVPARRIDGLVYLINQDKVPAFYWHEWVEAYVGEWIQLDPTFGQDVADATHIGLGSEASAQIAPLMGSLAIQVLE